MDRQPDALATASLFLGAAAGVIAVKVAILYGLTGIFYGLGVLAIIIALIMFGLRFLGQFWRDLSKLPKATILKMFLERSRKEPIRSTRVYQALACSSAGYVTLATRPAASGAFF
jgi:hypothetical protein